jgi:hypothetical protein
VTIVFYLLLVQGILGAFDTLYYHEWRARLPARYPQTAPELKLHAARDFLYAVLFLSLPAVEWHGAWIWVLAAVLLAEIALTRTDFIVEYRVRHEFGDVAPGERVTHAVMGILYGAMAANLLPTLAGWHGLPTGFDASTAEVPAMLRYALLLLGLGVAASGVRDLYAAYGLPHGGWPWPAPGGETAGRVAGKSTR